MWIRTPLNAAVRWSRCSALPVADEAEQKRVQRSARDESDLSLRIFAGHRKRAVAATSSKTGGYNNFCPSGKKANRIHPPLQKTIAFWNLQLYNDFTKLGLPLNHTVGGA